MVESTCEAEAPAKKENRCHYALKEVIGEGHLTDGCQGFPNRRQHAALHDENDRGRIAAGSETAPT